LPVIQHGSLRYVIVFVSVAAEVSSLVNASISVILVYCYFCHC